MIGRGTCIRNTQVDAVIHQIMCKTAYSGTQPAKPHTWPTFAPVPQPRCQNPADACKLSSLHVPTTLVTYSVFWHATRNTSSCPAQLAWLTPILPLLAAQDHRQNVESNYFYVHGCCPDDRVPGSHETGWSTVIACMHLRARATAVRRTAA